VGSLAVTGKKENKQGKKREKKRKTRKINNRKKKRKKPLVETGGTNGKRLGNLYRKKGGLEES